MRNTADSVTPNHSSDNTTRDLPTVADILRALGSLSVEELDQVVAKIALLKANPFGVGRTPSANPARSQGPTNGHDELLLLAICEFFEGQGEKCYPALLRRVQGYAAFKQKVEPITLFLTKGAGGVLSRTELQAFFRVGVSMLHYNMQAMKIAVSPRTMMNQIHRIPSVIELSFPGYTRMGILRLVITRR